MYDNAEGSTPQEKINSMRRMLAQQKGGKVNITEQAIDKVKAIKIKGYSDDALIQIQSMNKEILKVSKERNSSNEVAMIWSKESGISKALLGDKEHVDPDGDVEFSALLRRAPFRSLVLSHNHPSTSYFSCEDVGYFVSHPSIKTIEVVTNKGKTWHITKNEKYNDLEVLQKYKDIIKENQGTEIDKIVDLFLDSIYDCTERNR